MPFKTNTGSCGGISKLITVSISQEIRIRLRAYDNKLLDVSAADIIKIAMIRIHDEFKKQSLKSKMLLQVHDELVFDVHNSEKDGASCSIE